MSFFFVFPIVFNEKCFQHFFILHDIRNDNLLLDEIESACSAVGRVENIIIGICGVELDVQDKTTIVCKLMEIVDAC